jgi:hypothetical protein
MENIMDWVGEPRFIVAERSKDEYHILQISEPHGGAAIPGD